MGEANKGLKEKISPIFQRYTDLSKAEISTKPSAAGKYESITVTFTAESQEQLDSIYMEITALPEVLMAL